MGLINIKALKPEEIAKKAQEALKPIVVKMTENSCRICGGKRKS